MKIQVEKDRQLVIVNQRLPLAKQEPMIGTITKIGRMYFTVTLEDKFRYYGDTYFLKESCKPKDRNSLLEIFPTKDQWLEKRTKKRLFNNIKQALTNSNALSYSTEQLRTIAFILNVLEE